MKILIVNKFLYPNGGSETYIFELGKQFQRMGHEVQYFGMEHEGRVVGNDADSYTSDMDFHGSGLDKLLYPFRILYSFEARKKLRIVLNDFQPDVVHLNNINFQLTPSVIDEVDKFKRKKIKLIYTAHDSQWVCPNHLMMLPGNNQMCFECNGGHYGCCIKNRCIHGSMAKSVLGAMEAVLHSKILKTYAKVDKIICPSQFMRERLETNPILKDKLVVIHNFLNTQQVSNVQKKKYVLYFGRYSEEKGVRTLLEVCKKVPSIPFIFAGTGPLVSEIQDVDNIKDVGFQTGEDLIRLISEASLCVFPSECNENCPFTVMESQMYGTPVLASNVGGVSELIKDGETGEVYRSGNKGELYDKLVRLWEDKKCLARYVENCKNVDFMSPEAYCNQLLEKIYKE